MKDGFIKVAAVTPKVRVADPAGNKQAIIEKIEEAEQKRAAAVVFPELCITGYTCGDLFLMEPLLASRPSSPKICSSRASGESPCSSKSVTEVIPATFSSKAAITASSVKGIS